MFAEIFLENFNLDNSGSISPVISSKSTLTLHNISLSLKIIQGVITAIASSGESCFDCSGGSETLTDLNFSSKLLDEVSSFAPVIANFGKI